MAPQIHFLLQFEWSKTICRPNFVISQSMAKMLLLLVSENKQWLQNSNSNSNSTFGSDINLFLIIRMSFCIGRSNFIQIRPPPAYLSFKMAAVASKIYFQFWVWWRHSHKKLEIYLQTKFRQYISTHSRDVTSSVFWKQMSAILEFYI